MEEHVAASAPLEACGLLGGKVGLATRLYLLENELHSPTRYRIDPQAQLEAFLDMEAHELDLVAIFHSHPQGPSHPSATDIAEAAYSQALHLIWSPRQDQWECRAFRLGAKAPIQVELRISETQATSP